MQGARLLWAQMQGADLRRAQLQGSILERAQFQGADLRGSRLWQIAIDTETNLGSADLLGASWQPIDKKEAAQLREIIHTFPADEDRQKASKERLERLIASDAGSRDPPEFALDGPLLVDDVDDPRWQRLDRQWLTTDERAYDEALVPFLADLARSDPQVARGLASRIETK